jgi:hypothetical protein
MKLSGEEMDSAAFSLLVSHESEPRERFKAAADGTTSSHSSRLIVSCGYTGLANDYLRFLNEESAKNAAGTSCELLSPEILVQKMARGEIRPVEIVLFLDQRVSGQVLNLFAGLSQLASIMPFTCLMVLPSLLNHLCPNRHDGMQALLDQLSESFRKSEGRSTADPDASRTDFSESISMAGTTPASSNPLERSGAVQSPGKARLIVLRTGYLLSPSSLLTNRLRQLRRFHVLMSPELTSTFVAAEKLFSAINAELEPFDRDRQPRAPILSSAEAATADSSFDRSQSMPDESSSRTEVKSLSGSSDAGCSSESGSTRYLTILGIRRSWQAVLTEQMPAGSAERSPGNAESLAASLCRRLGFSWLACTLIRLVAMLVPSFRQIHFDTLKPRSVREIISLYNRHNCRDVQLAGYNNGVNHFGWKFPEKTVVLTTGIPGKTQLSDGSMLDLEARLRSAVLGEKPDSPSPDRAAASGTHFTVDAGLTLKHCIQELNKVDREFYVVPNYSWISMGTLYFVPVHGSGSHVSTLGDTIEDVLLYDGETEDFIFARRGDKLFRDAMYDTSRHRLLLRLTLRVKPKSVYSVKHETLENPSAEDVLKVFEDPEASNVEIRKNRAASTSIDIRRYYVDSPSAVAGALEMPRDSIGRVWDRLEETPVVSTLFHWFVRRFAFHVELFLRPEEFVIFWNHHKTLPISKIQLRQMLKDGITNSACAHENCLSADLFMTRTNRDVFLGFISTHLPLVRCNPGKQSL